MKTYKLFRIKNGKLYPLYVLANKETPLGIWLKHECGLRKEDGNHVKSKLGDLAFRSGWHSGEIPDSPWIGKRIENGILIRRKDNVWCECEVKGKLIECTERNGFKDVPDDSYYLFRTNSKQQRPWIISDWIKVNRILSDEEVFAICRENGIEPQPVERS